MRIYLETTAFNYYFDRKREGHEDVVQLFEAIAHGKHEGFTSEYVTDELEKCPEPKRWKMLILLDLYGIDTLDKTDSVDSLAKFYVAANIVPKSKMYDARHIASASITGLDVIVSYNFAHINRTKTKELTTSINNIFGYGKVAICTAKDVLEYGRVRNI